MALKQAPPTTLRAQCLLPPEDQVTSLPNFLIRAVTLVV